MRWDILLLIVLIYFAMGCTYAQQLSMRKEKRSVRNKMVIAWLPAFFSKRVARWIYK